MSWQQLVVTAPENAVEPISELISNLGAVSVTYLDAQEQPVYEPNPGATIIWKQTRIVGLFTMECDLDLVKAVINKQFNDTRLDNWQTQVLQDQAWERTWMDHYKPMKFGHNLWVCPSEQEQDEANTVCLTLDPGLAFGTGTHATTALCLEWLAEHPLNNFTVIDYGCGSGILAIAALLLGAKQAYAVDIDPQALTACHENAIKNHLIDKIHICQPESLPELEADLVIANILAKPLVLLAPEIISLIKPGGQLILSGILNEQAESIKTAYQQNIVFKSPQSQDDWLRMNGTKMKVTVQPPSLGRRA